MSDDLSLGHQITLQLMPFLMLVGAIMSLGANFWLPPFLLLGMCFALVVYWIYTMKDLRFQLKDLRFLILPSVVLGIGFLTHYHLIPAFYDQAYHLQISNRILDRWDWEPTHQGMSYSFRPEILSGIAAVELWMTGRTSSVLVVPAVVLIAAAWSIQHLSERFSDWKFGFIASAAFCTFPIVVIYGRTMLMDVALAGMIVSILLMSVMACASKNSNDTGVANDTAPTELTSFLVTGQVVGIEGGPISQAMVMVGGNRQIMF